MIIMSPFNQCLCYVHVIWWVFRFVGYFQYLCATTVEEDNYKLFLLPMLALFIMLACPLWIRITCNYNKEWAKTNDFKMYLIIVYLKHRIGVWIQIFAILLQAMMMRFMMKYKLALNYGANLTEGRIALRKQGLLINLQIELQCAPHYHITCVWMDCKKVKIIEKSCSACQQLKLITFLLKIYVIACNTVKSAFEVIRLDKQIRELWNRRLRAAPKHMHL